MPTARIKEMIPAIYLTLQPEDAKCGRRITKIQSMLEIRPTMGGYPYRCSYNLPNTKNLGVEFDV